MIRVPLSGHGTLRIEPRVKTLGCSLRPFHGQEPITPYLTETNGYQFLSVRTSAAFLLEHPPSFHRPNQTVEGGFIVPSPAIAPDRIRSDQQGADNQPDQIEQNSGLRYQQ